MGENSGISWTDATANVVVGCSRISEGCQNCYAERLAATRLAHTKRYKGLAVMRESGKPQWMGEVRLVPEAIEQVLRWRAPRKIFLTAMGDPFHDGVSDDDLEFLFGAMHVAGHHTFQVLTKRPKRMAEFIKKTTAERCLAEFTIRLGNGVLKDQSPTGKSDWSKRMPRGFDWPLKNVWLGVSVENQATANERIPHLLATPASVRFLSCEPLLEAVDLTRIVDPNPAIVNAPVTITFHALVRKGGIALRAGLGIDWVIAGGESGSGARPFDLAWARSLRDQCASAGVAYFCKQLGSNAIDSDGFDVMNERGEVAYSRGNDVPGVEAMRLEALHKGRILRPRNYSRFLRDRAGADIAEFPEDLRIQQFPEVPRG